MPTLNTVFKQVFSEALAPLGFTKIKGRQPYFVRVVEGGAIIHVITCREEQSSRINYVEFDVECGVATVYRQSIDLTLSLKRNSNWLRSNWWIYSKLNPWNDDPESEFRKFRDSIYRFSCEKDEESIVKGVQHALEVTKNIMLPVLDKITDFEACIEYQHVIGITMSFFYDDENFGNDHPGNFYNEGLLYIKADKDIFRKLMENSISEIALREKAFFEKIYECPELYCKAQAELERRKAANIDILRSYGLNL